MKSNGFNKINTAVFISGNGSNLKSLIRFSLSKNSPINIKFVLSDKKNAKGLRFPKLHNINYKIYNFSDKSNVENKIIKDLKKKTNKINLFSWFFKNFIKKFY